MKSSETHSNIEKRGENQQKPVKSRKTQKKPIKLTEI